MSHASAYPWEPGDVLVIETPEQTHLELHVASFGSRILAAFLDRLIILAGTIFLGLLGVLVVGALGLVAPSQDLALAGVGVLIVIQFLLSVFYFVWAEVRGEGQTPGKRRLRIRTVLGSGQGLTLGAALLRNLARQVDEIPLMWLIPTLLPGCRRMGDLLAGTYVVKAEPPVDYRADPRVGWPAASYRELVDKDYADLLSTDVARAGLYPDDLNLIEYLLVRIQEAPPARRPKLLRIMAGRYVRRLGLEEAAPRVEQNPRRFLQELALSLRERFGAQTY